MIPRPAPDDLIRLAVHEEARDIAAQWSPLLYQLEYGATEAAEAEAESALELADTILPGDLS